MKRSLFLTLLISLIPITFGTGCAAVRLITGDPDPETERQDWRESYQERLNNAYRARDLALGMDMGQVRHIWGTPGDVEYAGNPNEGNARWTYFQGPSSAYNVSGRRVVYFEEGQVVGWETARQ